jgi:DNA-binding CsgD family transcriptional regulator
VAVDDAHWADAASLRYLYYLARRLEDLAVTVVVASRPPSEHQEAELLAHIVAEPITNVIRPSPLSEEAVARLVAGSLNGPADMEFCQACRETTGGNPFLVRHLLAALRQVGVVSSAALAPAVFTIAPDVVTRATRRQLLALPSSATRVARAVAVLGDDAQLDMVAALAGADLGSAASAADQLASVGVLDPRRPLAFVHPILRSVVYEDIPIAQRSLLHGRAAQLLARSESPPARVAGQLLLTEPRGDVWVTEALRLGAAAAVAAGDPTAAVVLLQRALTEPPPAELRSTVLFELGLAEQTSRSPSAIDHLSEAYKLATERRQQVAVLRALLLALMGADRALEVEPLLDSAIVAARSVDPDLGLQLEAEVLSTARFSLHGQAWGQARVMHWRGKLRGRTSGERLLLANLCDYAAISEISASEAAELAERALGDGALLREQTADALPFYQAVYVLTAASRLDRAAALLAAARSEALARGSQLGFAMASLFRSWVELSRGRVGEAEAEADAALRAAGDEHVWPAGFPICVAAVIDVLVVRGHFAEAERLLEHHDLRFPRADGLPLRVLLHSRGELRLATGDAQGALDDFDEFDRREAALPALNPWVNFQRHGAVLALARLGQVDEARRRARAGLAAAHHWGTEMAIGRALHALGTVSPAPEADVHLAEAVTALAASPARLDHAAALVELGALRRRSGSRRAAEAELRAGLDLAGRLGAARLVERARGELLAMGRRPRRTALTGLDALTGSERRVADLAAQGMTNKTIAESLFITTRTVEIHLSSAYRKLGIDSRQGLRDVWSHRPADR